MSETLSLLHSYAGGDLITILPGLRHVHKETGKKWLIYQKVDYELFYYEGMIPATVNVEGKAVSMNQKHFEMLKPLLLAQDYIEDFIVWKGEKCDIDMDKSRDSRSIPMPYVPLHQLPFLIAPELQCDLSYPWLKVEPAYPLEQITIDAAVAMDMSPEEVIKIWEQTGNLYYKAEKLWTVFPAHCKDKVLINRTQRYTNPNINYFFLKQYENDLIFTGTEVEYKVFCKQWDLNIPYLIVNNFLELTQAIQISKFCVGNQSLFWHLCDAISKHRILEVCGVFPNTFPNTPNGRTFIYQEGAELLFHKMFNK